MKSYLRFLSRNKLYTAIMAVGMSVALAFVIIMSCYVWQNISVSKAYPDSDKIYLIGHSGTTHSNFNLGQMIQDELPEVEESVTATSRYGKFSIDGIEVENNTFLGIDPDFFDMFPTEFVHGDREAFNDFGNVIISKSLADKMGGEKVLGMTIKDNLDQKEFRIGAVVEGFENTVFANADVIMNTRSPFFDRRRSEPFGLWTSGTFTFIRPALNTDINELTSKLEKMVEENIDERFRHNNENHITLTRLDKLYLSDVNDGRSGLKKGNRGLMSAFSISVLFLLISAIFNYINLSTALGGKRSKEIAIRMLLGQNRRKIFVSNALESLGFIAVCMLLAFIIADACLPFVNKLLNSPIPIEIKFTEGYLYAYLLIMAVCASLCGIVPAMISNNFTPIEIVKGEYRYRSRRTFNKVFITIQNTIAIIMIAMSLTMQTQMKHMMDMPLNANINNLYKVDMVGKAFVNDLSELPYVGKIGRSDGMPGQRYMTLGMPLNEDRSKQINVNACRCDSTAFEMFKFKVVKNYGLPGNKGLWLTESAFKVLELDENNPVAPEAMSWFSGTTDIAGIIEDVQLSSAINLNTDNISVISLNSSNDLRRSSYILELVNPTDTEIRELDRLCEEETKRVNGQYAQMMSGYIPYLHAKAYDGMKKQRTMVSIFMAIAIALSALGQMAMSTYYAAENIKAISIRKIFGGTISSESKRIISEYMLYCLAATVIALPVSIWLADRYLEKFVYQMEMKNWIYAIAALSCFAISLLSVLWQTLRAAHINPAEALKKE